MEMGFGLVPMPNHGFRERHIGDGGDYHQECRSKRDHPEITRDQQAGKHNGSRFAEQVGVDPRCANPNGSSRQPAPHFHSDHFTGEEPGYLV